MRDLQYFHPRCWCRCCLRDVGVFTDSDLVATTHVRKTVPRRFAAFRQLRHLRRNVTDDFSLIIGVDYPLATRLCKLHVGWATSLPSATTPVCAQHCSSSRVPASTLRPHHWRPCSPALAACTTTGRLQSCGHGVSSTDMVCLPIPGSASSCC